MDETFVEQEAFKKALRQRDGLQRKSTGQERPFREVIGVCIDENCTGFLWIEQKWVTVKTGYPGPNIREIHCDCSCDCCGKSFSLNDPQIVALVEARSGKGHE